MPVNLRPFAVFIGIFLKIAGKIVKSYIVFQTGTSKEKRGKHPKNGAVSEGLRHA